MFEARLLGVLIGLVALISGLVDYRKAAKSSSTLAVRDLAAIGVGLVMITLGLFPRTFDTVASLLGVQSLEGRRIGLLVVLAFAVLVWALYEAVGRIGRLEQEIGHLAAELSIRTPLHEEPDQVGEVAVVIPAFNEAGAIADVIGRIPAEVHGMKTFVVLVSDGSTDGTIENALSSASGRIFVVDRPLRRGSGAAVRTGLRFAFARGAEIVVTLDGDGQHDPEDVERMISPLIQGTADIAQGVRLSNDEEISGSRMRVLGIRFFGRMLTYVLGVSVTDPSNGYRAIRRDAYRRLQLNEDQFYVGELIVRSVRAGLRIEQVPIVVSPRSHGESKKPGSIGYGFGFAKGIVRALLRPINNR